MSDKLRKVDYFHVMIPNKAGQASKIAASLAAEGVNLLAFSGFPSGRETQLDLMPEDSSKLKRAAKKLGSGSPSRNPDSCIRARIASAQ
jgi:hypothetical protein